MRQTSPENCFLFPSPLLPFSLQMEAAVICLHQLLWTSSGTKPGLEKYQINSTFFRKWQIQFYTRPRGLALTVGVLILHSFGAVSRKPRQKLLKLFLSPANCETLTTRLGRCTFKDMQSNAGQQIIYMTQERWSFVRFIFFFWAWSEIALSCFFSLTVKCEGGKWNPCRNSPAFVYVLVVKCWRRSAESKSEVFLSLICPFECFPLNYFFLCVAFPIKRNIWVLLISDRNTCLSASLLFISWQ